jgi:ATP-dependent Zn protease
MGEGLAYFNTKSVEERDRIRAANRDVAVRVEGVLAREMKRSRDIVRRYRAVVEEVADALERSGLVEGREVARLLSGEASR